MSAMRYSNQQLIQEDTFTINSGNIAADGSYKEFDITGFANYAQIKQIAITQLTGTTANYTIEIWEKDASGYDPADTSKRYLRILTRDIDENEYNENIDGGIDYVDRDSTSELHMRLINQTGGTASDFDVVIKALVW